MFFRSHPWGCVAPGEKKRLSHHWSPWLGTVYTRRLTCCKANFLCPFLAQKAGGVSHSAPLSSDPFSIQKALALAICQDPLLPMNHSQGRLGSCGWGGNITVKICSPEVMTGLHIEGRSCKVCHSALWSGSSKFCLCVWLWFLS